MPRFYFDTLNSEHDEDQEGIDLPDRFAARREAVRFAGSVMKDQPDLLWDGTRFVVEVRGEGRTLLFKVSMQAEDFDD